jgi:AhpD family alkylhydroperoxidase
MDNHRVSLSRSSPDLFQTVSTLERQVKAYTLSAGISEGFTHLLRLRASQLNKCAYCVRMHTREALSCAETTDRISVLPAWRETEYFNDKERAALALIEEITLIARGQVPDSVYDQAVKILSDEEIVAVEWIGVVINAMNRISIPSRTPVKP